MGAQLLGRRDIIGTFFARLAQYEGASWIDKVSRLFNSDQESEIYRWLGQSPAMREWLGGRQAKGFRTNEITITNKKYEATVDFPLEWIERDKTGQILIRIAELAIRANSHWGTLLSTLISNGTGDTSGLCYDGQYFFDSDHSEGSSGTQLNLLTNSQVGALDVTTATTPTPVEAAKAILGVIGYMLAYKDDQGEPMNTDGRNFLVMTSPILWQFLAPAVYNRLVSSGETNPLAAVAEADDFNIVVHANPRLSYTTQFVVFRTDAPSAPFIRQNEKNITPSFKGANSDYEHDNDAWQLGIKARRNVGYGYWQYAAHATLS